ncbi:YbaK/EbsC family protein [Streptomyces sp. YIM 98790]|uniref:YbaK/EbsC family protein n=1 Tax=Streptomyces sp. YIM 98790 TaxID=2689077 RepID=UPI00140CBD95|nr:YbaK/EbsC family protein [Streptomyces sp. YIM 98790]
MRAPIGSFDEARPVTERLDVLPAPVAGAFRAWRSPVPADQVLYVGIDPELADTAAFVEHYGKDLEDASVNCVIVAAKRGGETTLAACLVRSATRLDVNNTVRRRLGARKASFAPRETATGETGMEYGSITPIGLPAGWPLLIDATVAALPYALIGSGTRRGKLIAPGKALAGLPGAALVEDLGR